MSDLIVGAARAAHVTEDAASEGSGFSRVLSDAKAGQSHGPRPPKPGEDDVAVAHESGLGGLWDDAVSGVKTAYNAANGAVHDLGQTVDKAAEHGIDDAAAGLRNTVGDKAAQTFKTAAEGVRDSTKQTVGLAYGVGEGATEAVGEMAEGVGDLVEGGAKFATDSQFRGQVVNGARALASHVAHDPAGSAKALGNSALQAGKDWLHGAGQAAQNGTLGEYVGKGAGSAAVNIGSFFIPGADAAEGANIAGRLGEAGKVADEAVNALHAGETAVQASKPVVISLRGVEHTIPDWHLEPLSYTKRAPEARQALRKAFDGHVRKNFVQDLANNHTDLLKQAGFKPKQIERMASGRIPEGYQVHHILPLDDGGTNAPENLVLIKNDPDHMLVTKYQNSATRGLESGSTKSMQWPVPDHPTGIWPERPGAGAKPVAPTGAKP